MGLQEVVPAATCIAGSKNIDLNLRLELRTMVGQTLGLVLGGKDRAPWTRRCPVSPPPPPKRQSHRHLNVACKKMAKHYKTQRKLTRHDKTKHV